jgi:hypothetical protein
LFHRRIERMMVLLHLKIPHKLSLLLKIHHLHNLLSIILHHVLLFQSLLTLPLLFKIHHLHNLLSIILYYISLLTLPLLLKIHQLNKLFSIVLHHMFILQSLLLT